MANRAIAAERIAQTIERFDAGDVLLLQNEVNDLPAMIEAGQGTMVNVSSDAGRVGSLGETVYAGAKGGVIAFSKSLAREMARNGITVNCVAPGPTETALLADQPERIQEALKRAIPLRRLAQPEDIADAILFFCSDRSSYITGQVLSVSGGLTMHG